MATQISETGALSITGVTERRRFARIRLQVPLFIRGTDADGAEFLELAKTLNIGSHGALLLSRRAMQLNDNISLNVPAPLPRSSGFGECGTPPIPARVRRIESNEDVEVVAVEFLKPLS